MTTFTDVEITLHWYDIEGDNDPRWEHDLALYAYLAPDGREILYIGKCDRTTVRGRWRYSSKSGTWDSINQVCDSHCVIVAEIEANERVTRQLLADIESLLIYEVNELQPLHNVQNTGSRGQYRRPSMRIQCRGAWPLSKRVFVDD
jgi:hypothetical protein